MSFLRHIFNKDEIVVDSEKVKEVVKWPTSKTMAEIRSFLRLVGYYKRFVEGLSKIT